MGTRAAHAARAACLPSSHWHHCGGGCLWWIWLQSWWESAGKGQDPLPPAAVLLHILSSALGRCVLTTSSPNPTRQLPPGKSRLILSSSFTLPAPVPALARASAPSDAFRHTLPGLHPCAWIPHVPADTGGATLLWQNVCFWHTVPKSTLALAKLNWGSSLGGGPGRTGLLWVQGGLWGLPGVGMWSCFHLGVTALTRDVCQLVSALGQPQSLLLAGAGHVGGSSPVGLCRGPPPRAAQLRGCRALMRPPLTPNAPRSSATAKPTGSRRGPCCSQPASARSGS